MCRRRCRNWFQCPVPCQRRAEPISSSAIHSRPRAADRPRRWARRAAPARPLLIVRPWRPITGAACSTDRVPLLLTTVASSELSHGFAAIPGRQSHTVLDCGATLAVDDDDCGGEVERVVVGAAAFVDELEQAAAATISATASTRTVRAIEPPRLGPS